MRPTASHRVFINGTICLVTLGGQLFRATAHFACAYFYSDLLPELTSLLLTGAPFLIEG
jgi:hypothetical protein